MSAEVHDISRGRGAKPRAELTPVPISIEAEQAVLGTLLMHNETLGAISANASGEDFSEEIHRRMFAVISDLVGSGQPAKPSTIIAFLGDQELSEGVTISRYIAHVCAAAMPVSMAVQYATFIRNLSYRRRLITQAADLDDRARNAEVREEPATIAAEFILSLQGIASASGTDTTRPIADYADELVDLADSVRSGEMEYEPITTGYKDLDSATSGYEPGTMWITAGRPGMGKAQPLTSKIKTAHGWISFADVKVGDQIASVDSRPSHVIGVQPRGRREVFKISFSDGRQTRCCGDHLWEVMYREWDCPRVISTTKMINMLGKERYKNRLSVRQITGDFGHDDILPIDPWAVGAIIGNGCVRNCSASFTTNDPETVLRLQEAVSTFGVRLLQVSEYGYNLTTPDGKRTQINPLTRALKKIGLWGAYSYEKRIPESYMLANRANRLALLQGMMDTDGWVEKHGTALYATASIGLADDVAELARSLGYWAKIAEREAFIHSQGKEPEQKLNSFKVCVTGPGIEEICSLSRKRERLENRTWFRSVTVCEIVPDGIEECACISVSHPSHLYITDDYIVTHNSIYVNSSAVRVARKGVGVLEFPLEIGPQQAVARHIADLAFRSGNRVAFRDIGRRAKELTDTDMVAIRKAQGHLRELPIEIDRRSRVTVAQIAAKVAQTKRSMAARGIRLGVVFIDHLDFIHASDRYSGNRTQEIGEICIALKDIARSQDVCVNLLCQLNRDVEKRPAKDRRPSLADLRNSGDLEQVADVVMFLYREEYYLTRSPEYLASDEAAMNAAIDAKGKLEAILGKVRAGPTPTVHLFCEPASSSISSFERQR
jgi:replicative DNA helicase